MDQRQRTAMQRVLVQEALGKLNAVSELFGAEESAIAGDQSEDLRLWEEAVERFRLWVFTASPIA
jgi:hypothetical protein